MNVIQKYALSAEVSSCWLLGANLQLMQLMLVL